MIITVLLGTPLWVWGLLAGLIALGVSQAMTREIAPRRVALLPAVMLPLSLLGVLGNFHGEPGALAAWAAGGALAATAAAPLVAPRGAHWSAAARRFHLPGSWLPLALILAIFGLRYSVGASLALNPSLAADRSFAAAASLGFGLCSGLFVARALALWKLVRG